MILPYYYYNVNDYWVAHSKQFLLVFGILSSSMASYKVPQDVEADDKLIGPFSFRQFIYLIIVAIAIALAWGLGNLFLPLAIIPLPVILFFGALALPLRKDQPMEVYLAAVVTFFLRPRKRLWVPDGKQSLIEITAPKKAEVQRTKNLSENEAEQRLSYLANLVDSRGWAVRGVANDPQTAMQNDAYYAAQQTEDVLDARGGVAQTFDTMMTESNARHREAMINRMHTTVGEPQLPATPPIPDPYASLTIPPVEPAADEPDPKVNFNPYPNAIHQSVIQPYDPTKPTPAPRPQNSPTPKPQAPAAAPTPEAPKQPSKPEVSPDIINLATNPDLSIETIAHEANRIHQKEAAGKLSGDDEVVISLR